MSFWSDAAPFIGGGIGYAVGGPIGGYVGANLGGQFGANQQNQENNDKSRSLALGMSNTAHQREVKDLQRAGLNPILSAGGSGASTSSGGNLPVQAPQIDLPSILQVRSLNQTDTKLNQDQQRINIDKGVAATNIIKNTNEAELARVNAAAKKGGALTNFLGTDTYDSTSKMKVFPQRSPLGPKFNPRGVSIPRID